MKKTLLIIFAIVMPFLGGNILCAQTFLYSLPNNTGYLAIKNGTVLKYYRNAPSNIPDYEVGSNNSIYPYSNYVSLEEKDTLCARQGHPIISSDSLVDVIIPPMVIAPNGAVLHVTDIDKWAFKHDPYVLSITIPYTVSHIRPQAIYACHHLKRIVIEERPEDYDGPSLFINYWAIIYCDSLQYLHLPTTVYEVRNGSFFHSIPDTLSYNVKNLRVYISESDFPNYTSYDDRDSWRSKPFSYTGWTNYYYGQKWKQTKVIMGDSVERIAKDIFTPFFGGDTIIVGTNVREIESIRSKYKYVILPDDLETIDDSSIPYYNNFYLLPDSLREIVIPDKVSSPIRRGMLAQPTLRKITLGKSITYIGNQAITKRIDTLIIRSRNIQNLSSSILYDNSIVPHAHIIVPCGKIDDYRGTSLGMYGDVTWEEDTNCHLMVTTRANNDTYGTVSGGGYHEVNTEVTINATPYDGYRFVKWVNSEGNVSYSREKTFLITDDIEYTAFFEPLQSINDTYPDSDIISVIGRRVIVNRPSKENLLLLDVLGRIITQTTEQHYTSPILPQGVYLVKIGHSPARKVIVL